MPPFHHRGLHARLSRSSATALAMASGSSRYPLGNWKTSLPPFLDSFATTGLGLGSVRAGLAFRRWLAARFFIPENSRWKARVSSSFTYGLLPENRTPRNLIQALRSRPEEADDLIHLANIAPVIPDDEGMGNHQRNCGFSSPFNVYIPVAARKRSANFLFAAMRLPVACN